MGHRVRGIIVLTAALLLSVPAQAQFDHLQCWKIKPDSRTKGFVDLTPLQAQLPPGKDCRIVGPKLFCAPVLKQIVEVDPPPIGAPAGPDVGDFLCYKAKCKIPPATLLASDQFNSYQLTLKKSFLLCAPARKEGATTSTTIPITTTSIPQDTTTTTKPPETTTTTVQDTTTTTKPPETTTTTRQDTTTSTIITTSTTLKPCGLVDTPSGPQCGGDCPVATQVCLNNVLPTDPVGTVNCECVDISLKCENLDTCTQGLCPNPDERCDTGATSCLCLRPSTTTTTEPPKTTTTTEPPKTTTTIEPPKTTTTIEPPKTTTTIEPPKTTTTTIIVTHCGLVDTPNGPQCGGECPVATQVCLNNVLPTDPLGTVKCECVDISLKCEQQPVATCKEGLCSNPNERCDGVDACTCL